MREIFIKTKKPKEVADITLLVEETLEDLNAKDGLVNLFLTHTTVALTTADLDPGTDLDMLDAFAKIVPAYSTTGKEGLPYRHPHDPAHVPDHILSSVIGTSLTIPVKDDKLILGTWQRIVLIELDGPKNREIIINYLKN